MFFLLILDKSLKNALSFYKSILIRSLIYYRVTIDDWSATLSYNNIGYLFLRICFASKLINLSSFAIYKNFKKLIIYFPDLLSIAAPKVINDKATIFKKVTESPRKNPIIEAIAMLPPIIIGPPTEIDKPEPYAFKAK